MTSLTARSWPYAGDFTGVQITDNIIRTDGAMIKVGIAMGPLTWGSGNASWYRNFGATVTRNTFQSSGGAFAYGMCVPPPLLCSADRFAAARPR